MYYTAVVRESQPDWITAGAHTRSSVQALRDLASDAQQEELSNGDQAHPWRLLGYEGWRAGRVRWGECRGWGLLQLSGERAYQLGAAAYDAADSVSRLDLAVTVQPMTPDPNLGRAVYDQAHLWRQDHPQAAEPWFVGGDDGGWTTYIGKRQSDTFFRCYDKGAESRAQGDDREAAQYADCWRMELELKGDYAERVAAAIYRSQDEQAFTRAHVWRYLTDRGINPPFDVDGPTRKLTQLRRRSDRERKLDWLARQVRPTVTWLTENGDSGSVLAALGLAIIDNNLCQLAVTGTEGE